MTHADPSAQSTPMSLWTRLVVEPVASPLAQACSRWPAITPNRVTLAAGSCAVLCAVAFASGRLALGGALFLLRYVLDCVDGKVARITGMASARGAALDIHVDVAGITLCAAALAFHLVQSAELALAGALAFLAALVVYNFGLAYRKDVARRVGRGTGGSQHDWAPRGRLLGRWVRWCRDLGMMPIPWTADVETVIFGLAPLLLAVTWQQEVILGGTAFYLLASALNWRRVWQLATAALEHEPHVRSTSEHLDHAA